LGAKLAHGISAKRLSMMFGLFLLIAAGRLALAEEEFKSDAPIHCYDCEEWNQPQAPFHIFGNTYYVGVAGLSAILIDAGNELAVIDGGLPQSAQLIIENIRELGFDPRDVTTIMLSHAHFDHAGGMNALQKYTGAKILSSTQGAKALRAGALLEDDPQFGQGAGHTGFPATQNVKAVTDGVDHVIGDTSVQGIYTAGHTPGGMSWTWQSCEEERCLNVVYADSTSAVSAAGYRFSDGMGDTLRVSAERIAALDCDILLVTHPFYFDMQAKHARGREAFIDDTACNAYGQAALAKIQERLEQEGDSSSKKH